MPYKDKKVWSDWKRRWYKRMKESRRCVGCGAPLVEGDGVCCINCRLVKDNGKIRSFSYATDY